MVTLSRIFIPYVGKAPAAVSIKGHRFVIVARDAETLEGGKDLIGADGIRRMKSRYSEEVALERLAKKSHAHLLIAPPETTMGELLQQLNEELPWVQ